MYGESCAYPAPHRRHVPSTIGESHEQSGTTPQSQLCRVRVDGHCADQRVLFGPNYVSFIAGQAGIDGGFYKTDSEQPMPKTAPLIVIYSDDLESTEAAVTRAGGSIAVPTFPFPGGRRFHFNDGAGNVLAVWSE